MSADWVNSHPWDEYLDSQWHEYTQGVHWGCPYSKGAAIRVGRQVAQRRNGWLEVEHTGPKTFRARFHANDAG
jgi:hypothetical protein